MGGACERCGGNFHSTVYELHHRNPKKKQFGFSAKGMSGKTWEEVVEEATKCSLLCANCHREVHAFNDRRFLES